MCLMEKRLTDYVSVAVNSFGLAEYVTVIAFMF